MAHPTVIQAYTPFFPPGPVPKVTRNKNKQLLNGEPPQKPDWLMIIMGALFLLTLVLLWIVDIPHLLG